MSDIYTYKPDPQPNIRPEDQAKIDHLMSADPLKGFGFPGRDTGIIDDPFEILRMRAKDEEITAQIREKLKYSDADNPSFSRPLAEKLFEAPKYKDITALVEIDLSTDKPEVVHLRDDIIARKVNEGQSVKDSEYTGFMEAGNLALHPEYKAVFKKAKDLLENDPSLSVVKVEVQLEGREKMSIGIMRPMVHEPVAELRARIGNNEVIDLDTSSGKPLPIVKEADGTTRVIKAEEIEQWNNAYPGEFKLFQKSQTQRVSKVTEVPVADLSSEGGKLAQDFFKAKIVPNCTAIIELDVVDGRSKGVHINPAILSSKVTPGADPRLDADTGFDGAAKVVLGTAGEDYLSQARETFLANPGKSTVTIPGDALGQPGKDVVIMRSPAPQVIRELRHNLRYDGTGGIISGFQLDPNSPTPIPMVEREKGKFTPLTKSELEAWERWYPGEIERFKKEHAKKHQTIKEGERQVAELVTPRDEAKVAQNMLTEMGAIKYVICVDPATGEPSSFHTKGRELSNAEMDIVKRNWNPNFGQIEAQKFASNPNLAADITYVGHDIVAVVNNKKLADIYTEGDINQILKDKHPAPLGADGKPLTTQKLAIQQYQDPDSFHKWITAYKTVTAEVEQRQSRVADQTRRSEAELVITPSDKEVAANLVHEREDLGFVVVLDPNSGNVTAMVSSEKYLPNFIADRASVIDLLDEARWGIVEQFKANPNLMLATLPTTDDKMVGVVNKNNLSKLFTTGDIKAMLAQWEAPENTQEKRPMSLQEMFYLQFNEPSVFGSWVESYKKRNTPAPNIREIPNQPMDLDASPDEPMDLDAPPEEPMDLDAIAEVGPSIQTGLRMSSKGLTMDPTKKFAA